MNSWAEHNWKVTVWHKQSNHNKVNSNILSPNCQRQVIHGKQRMRLKTILPAVMEKADKKQSAQRTTPYNYSHQKKMQYCTYIHICTFRPHHSENVLLLCWEEESSITQTTISKTTNLSLDFWILTNMLRDCLLQSIKVFSKHRICII